MPDSYTPGNAKGGVYTNETVGIRLALPAGFEDEPASKDNQELLATNAETGASIVVAYATDGVLDDFVEATYLHYKQQESPAYDYSADIVYPQIAGEARPLITTQMTHEGETSCTAMTFFEGDGHIVAVTATADNLDEATALVMSTESL